jgi:hypothetical protein
MNFSWDKKSYLECTTKEGNWNAWLLAGVWELERNRVMEDAYCG